MNQAGQGQSRPSPPGLGAGNPLEVALRYALEAAEQVTQQLLPLPTPCRGWDLRMLLLHASDSLAALTEGFDGGQIGLTKPGRDQEVPADPAREFGQRARRLLGRCAMTAQSHRVVTVSGCPMPTSLLVTAGALEVAGHGWDIAQTCGGGEPIPAPLAIDLLRAAPLLISRADRQQLFAEPVPAAREASPSDRLAAFLGRRAF
jgi:uncharacterized protein (TIGR03086 family)